MLAKVAAVNIGAGSAGVSSRLTLSVGPAAAPAQFTMDKTAPPPPPQPSPAAGTAATPPSFAGETASSVATSRAPTPPATTIRRGSAGSGFSLATGVAVISAGNDSEDSKITAHSPEEWQAMAGNGSVE